MSLSYHTDVPYELPKLQPGGAGPPAPVQEKGFYLNVLKVCLEAADLSQYRHKARIVARATHMLHAGYTRANRTATSVSHKRKPQV